MELRINSRQNLQFLCLTLALLIASGAGADSPAEQKAKAPATEPHKADSDEYFRVRQQTLPLAPRPEISELEHFTIFHDPSQYSAHPRQCPFKYLGGGEVIMGFTRATTVKGGDSYEDPNDVRHGFVEGEYKSRGVVVIRRSTDGGTTWPDEEESIVYESRMPMDKKRAFLTSAGSERAKFNMFSPESLFYFGRAYLPESEKETAVGQMRLVCFAIRSQDKGKTWETVPSIIKHPFSEDGTVHKDAYPVIRMPDGKTLLGVMTLNVVRRRPAVFSSTDQGITWNYLSQPVYDAREPPKGRFTYGNLLRRPNGDLHCYYLHIEEGEVVEGLKNAIALSVSKDDGRSWGEPTPIVGNGQGCWKEPGDKGDQYRSPWPIQLADGRILVLFARRRMPRGIGGVLSSDDGKTWSHEFLVRDDGSEWDLGYPMGVQLDDRRIFTGYYYTLPDGNKFGGTRFIAGSIFRLN